MNRRNRRRPAAFTLIELLLVITIIVLLIMMFLPIYKSTKDSLNRTHCALNLSKCQQVIIQYASNNNSWLPSFGCTNDLENGIFEGTGDTTTQFPMVNELKRYGASAAIFTCPASAAAQDHSYTEYASIAGVGTLNDSKVWSTWDAVSALPEGNPPYGFNTIGTYKQVWTYGYVFFNRCGSFCMFLDGRQMPYKSSNDGSLPLGADMIAYDSAFNNQTDYPSSPGNGWYGMAHEPNAILTQNLGSVTGGISGQNYPQTGGGNVVFLNGTCQWFDVGQLYSGLSVTSSSNTQPMFFGQYSDSPNGGAGGFGNSPKRSGYPQKPTYTQYYFGDKPQSASSRLSNN